MYNRFSKTVWCIRFVSLEPGCKNSKNVKKNVGYYWLDHMFHIMTCARYSCVVLVGIVYLNVKTFPASICQYARILLSLFLKFIHGMQLCFIILFTISIQILLAMVWGQLERNNISLYATLCHNKTVCWWYEFIFVMGDKIMNEVILRHYEWWGIFIKWVMQLLWILMGVTYEYYFEMVRLAGLRTFYKWTAGCCKWPGTHSSLEAESVTCLLTRSLPKS